MSINLSTIQHAIPFASFPLGIVSLILLSVEFGIRAPLILQNPLSQLILFAGFVTNIALLLLSFRAIAQVLSEKHRK